MVSHLSILDGHLKLICTHSLPPKNVRMLSSLNILLIVYSWESAKYYPSKCLHLGVSKSLLVRVRF
jgi:hypothetical protein